MILIYSKHNFFSSLVFRWLIVRNIIQNVLISDSKHFLPWSHGDLPLSRGGSPWRCLGPLELSSPILEPWRPTLEPWRPTLEPWRLTLEPWGLTTNPGGLESHPGAVEAHPGAVEVHPWSRRGSAITLGVTNEP
jgi:hypothetical protein